MVRNNQNTFGNKNTLFIKDDKILPVNKLTCSVFFLKKLHFLKRIKVPVNVAMMPQGWVHLLLGQIHYYH